VLWNNGVGSQGPPLYRVDWLMEPSLQKLCTNTGAAVLSRLHIRMRFKLSGIMESSDV